MNFGLKEVSEVGTPAVSLSGLFLIVWAGFVDPVFVKPEDLQPIIETAKKNTDDIHGIMVGIYELRIELINQRLMDLEAVERQRPLRDDEAYQQQELRARLDRVNRELTRLEG